MRGLKKASIIAALSLLLPFSAMSADDGTFTITIQGPEVEDIQPAVQAPRRAPRRTTPTVNATNTRATSATAATPNATRAVRATPVNNRAAIAQNLNNNAVNEVPPNSFRTYDIKQGDTIWSVAHRFIAPDRSTNEFQIVASIYRNNPQAFVGGNVNSLNKTTIRIPDDKTIALEDTRVGSQLLSRGSMQLPPLRTVAPVATVPSNNSRITSNEILRRNPTANNNADSDTYVATETKIREQKEAQAQRDLGEIIPTERKTQDDPTNEHPETNPIAPATLAQQRQQNSQVVPSTDINLQSLGNQLGDASVDARAIRIMLDGTKKAIDEKNKVLQQQLADAIERMKKSSAATAKTASDSVSALSSHYDGIIANIQQDIIEIKGQISKISQDNDRMREMLLANDEKIEDMQMQLSQFSIEAPASAVDLNKPMMMILFGVGLLSLVLILTFVIFKFKSRATSKALTDDFDLEDDFDDTNTLLSDENGSVDIEAPAGGDDDVDDVPPTDDKKAPKEDQNTNAISAPSEDVASVVEALEAEPPKSAPPLNDDEGFDSSDRLLDDSAPAPEPVDEAQEAWDKAANTKAEDEASSKSDVMDEWNQAFEEEQKGKDTTVEVKSDDESVADAWAAALNEQANSENGESKEDADAKAQEDMAAAWAAALGEQEESEKKDEKSDGPSALNEDLETNADDDIANAFKPKEEKEEPKVEAETSDNPDDLLAALDLDNVADSAEKAESQETTETSDVIDTDNLDELLASENQESSQPDSEIEALNQAFKEHNDAKKAKGDTSVDNANVATASDDLEAFMKDASPIVDPADAADNLDLDVISDAQESANAENEEEVATEDLANESLSGEEKDFLEAINDGKEILATDGKVDESLDEVKDTDNAFVTENTGVSEPSEDDVGTEVNLDNIDVDNLDDLATDDNQQTSGEADDLASAFVTDDEGVEDKADESEDDVGTEVNLDNIDVDNLDNLDTNETHQESVEANDLASAFVTDDEGVADTSLDTIEEASNDETKDTTSYVNTDEEPSNLNNVASTEVEEVPVADETTHQAIVGKNVDEVLNDDLDLESLLAGNEQEEPVQDTTQDLTPESSQDSETEATTPADDLNLEELFQGQTQEPIQEVVPTAEDLERVKNQAPISDEEINQFLRESAEQDRKEAEAQALAQQNAPVEEVATEETETIPEGVTPIEEILKEEPLAQENEVLDETPKQESVTDNLDEIFPPEETHEDKVEAKEEPELNLEELLKHHNEETLEEVVPTAEDLERVKNQAPMSDEEINQYLRESAEKEQAEAHAQEQAKVEEVAEPQEETIPDDVILEEEPVAETDEASNTDEDPYDALTKIDESETERLPDEIVPDIHEESAAQDAVADTTENVDTVSWTVPNDDDAITSSDKEDVADSQESVDTLDTADNEVEDQAALDELEKRMSLSSSQFDKDADADVFNMLSGEDSESAVDSKLEDTQENSEVAFSADEIANMMQQTEHLSQSASSSHKATSEVKLDNFTAKDEHDDLDNIADTIGPITSDDTLDADSELSDNVDNQYDGLTTKQHQYYVDELNLARLYFETGDTEEAIKIIDDVKEHGSSDLKEEASKIIESYGN